MQMDEGLDTGDMLLKRVVPLDQEETGGSLFDKLSDVGAELLLETLKGLKEGSILPVKQGDSPTDYAKMLKKDMGEIDWTRSAVTIERLIRGLNPWPSAYTHLNGKTLKIWRGEVLTEDTKEEPGTVIRVEKDGFVIQTGAGLLKVKELQLEGKKRMEAGAFLRGFQIKEGTHLCC
jgi:methionyl-tRNA formyltransferase